MNEDLVWEFDGADGRMDVMVALVARYLTAIDALVPEDHEDPMAQLAAELSHDNAAAFNEDPSLERLFPPALEEAEDAANFRRDAVSQQARTRLDAARGVLADLSLAEGDIVEVPLDRIDGWVATLSAIRAQWHVELTGTAERTASPTPDDIEANPAAAAVCDWLAFLIEDALETRMLAWTPPL